MLLSQQLIPKNPFVYIKTPRKTNNSAAMITVMAMAAERSSSATPQRRGPTMSAFEARVSLVFALASQTSALSQRLMVDVANEMAKYLFPNRRFESRNLEEALMSVPDLEMVDFKVLKRNDQFEIREVEPYVIAETTMPGKSGFDFYGASQSFNVLVEYLFGKNTKKETMDMTTPVFTRRSQTGGEKMEMTTPVITKREGQGKWEMSFVMPSKYGLDLPKPKDPSVTIKEVPRKMVAVVTFSGFVTDEEVEHQESRLRQALKNDAQFHVKEGTPVEVAQYNPPFTLPFTRRNEIALEVERK